MPRNVLVTGAAKRLGAAIARAVAASGDRVVIHYGGSHEEADALARELGGATVQGDLADTAGIPALFERARRAAGGTLHALVNSASGFEYDAPAAIDPALAARLFAVNCTAPAMLSAALAGQSELGHGAVVNLLDQKLANPNPDFFSYTCAKYALQGATVMLAQAFAPRVRVNAVAPGLTLKSGDQNEEQFARVANANLLQHPVGAEAVAEGVVYLLNAGSVTGQILHVDCGQRFVKRDGDVMFEGER